MVLSQQLEETRLRRKNRDAKRARSFEKGLQRVGPYKFHKDSNYRMSNPMPKKGRGENSPSKNPIC